MQTCPLFVFRSPRSPSTPAERPSPRPSLQSVILKRATDPRGRDRAFRFRRSGVYRSPFRYWEARHEILDRRKTSTPFCFCAPKVRAWQKIATELGCVSSTISNMLNNPPESQPKKPKAKAKPPPINLQRVFRASCPMRRKINTLHRDGQQLTKSEMYDILAAVVRNTAGLAR